MTTEASPMGTFSHYEIDIHRRPEGWVEIGADVGRQTRVFTNLAAVREELRLLDRDYFKTRTVWVDADGKRTTCHA